MKIVILGGAAATAELLRLVDAVLDERHRPARGTREVRDA